MKTLLKTTLLIVAMLMTAAKLTSQPIDAAVCKEDSYPLVNKYVEVLKTNFLIPFDSVTKPLYDSKFIRLDNDPIIHVGYDEFHYWFRFKIYNGDSTSRQLMLLLGQLGMREGELFQSSDDGWKSLGKIGYSYPFESRPYAYAHYTYPISIGPKTTDTFYLTTDESHAYRVIALALLHPKAQKKMEARFYFSFGLMIGMLLLFLFFNFYLYFSTFDKIHFWYSLYIVIQILLLFKHENLDAQFLGMDSRSGYRTLGMAGVAALSIGMLIQVLQLFFTNIGSKSLLYKTTSIVKWILFLSAAVHFFVFYIEIPHRPEIILFEIANKSTFVGLILIVINCVYSLYKGFNTSWLILVGLLIFLIGGFERILFLTSSSYLFPPSLFEIGMVIETIVISFGLMYRYRIYQREKEKITSELQKQKVVQVKKIISAQEEERKRIAEDLHDDLGSNLAVIKLNLQSLESDEGQKASLMQLLDDTSAHVRQVSHNLMPPEFANTNLKDVIAAYVQQLNEDSRVSFAFYQKGGSKYFGKDEELMIYRIVMELTSNILKHAEATEATSQLFYHDESFEMVVEDNGKGFSDGSGNGIGLKSIQSRVQYLQGELAIDSNKAGTTVIVSIPLKSKQNDG